MSATFFWVLCDATDVFYELSAEEKRVVWKNRDVCIRQYPRSLIKLLLSVDWLDRHAIAQLYEYGPSVCSSPFLFLLIASWLTD